MNKGAFTPFLLEFLKFHAMGYGLVELYDPIRRTPSKKMMPDGLYLANALCSRETKANESAGLLRKMLGSLRGWPG
ncbi:hypothetical protein ASF70_08155 [Rhizobium sp. Leaf321]|jgi:hypothetical protein|nr:hypothetical protein ASF70_08155 [Rhizobium sp. Leaf321]